MKSLRISGVYNLETLEQLFLQQIHMVGFDKRPTSLNFIQGHNVSDCLKLDNIEAKYYLHFCAEKDFVINSVLSEIKEKLKREDSLYLEFSDEMGLDYYESFQTPFLWHFKKSSNYHKIIESKWLDTLSLSNTELVVLEESGELFSFLNELFKICYKNNKKIELSLDWNSDVSSSLFDFYKFDSVHFMINSLVESSYRHINQGLLNSTLIHTKNVLEI